MIASGTKGGKKYSRLTWYALTIISWGVVVECGLIWAVVDNDNFEGIWIASAQFVAILSMAFSALFLAAYLMYDGGHDKKSRVSLAAFMLFMFCVLPVWAWMLPDDGTIAYGHWKLMGVGLITSFGLMLVIVIVQKYATGRKNVDDFFRWIGTLRGRLPSWAEFAVKVMLILAGLYILQWAFSSDASIYLNIRKMSLNFGLIKIRRFYSQMDLSLKNWHGFRTKKTTDGSETRTQLLNSLNVIAESMKVISEASNRISEASNSITKASNNITAEVKNLIAIVERMDDDSDKTGAK